MPHEPAESVIYREPGEAGRLHLQSRFAGEALQNRALIASTFTEHEVPVLPQASFVHLGGVSIMDRGLAVLEPLCDEVVDCRREHDLVLTVGGGVRERHTYALGVDLGLPTGGLAALGWMSCEQNAVMLFHLLATRRAIEVPYLHFEMLPVYLREGSIPILMSMPNYWMWETPGRGNRIPAHRADTGALLLAEVMAARSCILVKDVDGLYSADPQSSGAAEPIAEITISELEAAALPDLPVEPAALEVLALARNVRELRIINGLVPGQLRAALAGEPVGSVIRQG